MGNKNKQTKGIWIPEEIKVDKKLDWTNKALLSEIYSLCDLPDGCIASDNHFGKLLGIKRPSVNKRVNKLEELGYITATNHYKGKLCIGRTITKGSSVKKHTVVPEVDNVSSHDSQVVVLEVEDVSSLENTTNTLTNSDLTIQETIQNTGEVKNSAMSMNEFLNSRFEELIFELVEKSSLGEGIFFYTEPANLDMFRDAVDVEEYKLVYPVLVNVIDISRKLYGN
jgi:biotin operon repressor